MKLREIAAAIGATCEGDAEVDVVDLMPLDSAGSSSLTFLANPRYASRLSSTRAGAVILGPGVTGPGCAVLRVADPYLAFTRALEIFAAPLELPPGIDASARVAATATIGQAPRIAPGVVIGERCRIGARAVLHPGVVIYPDVEIGDDFTAHANVVIRERVRIGSRVMLASGVVIGSDGFGFVPLPGGGVVKLMQVGTVEIGDDVEIGANTTVDRATIGTTAIERGAKIDNLVMIAHGCRVGEEALIAAQTGLAGSTVVGARAQLGGQVGAAGHLTIGEGARLAAKTGVVSDVSPGAEMAGYPALEAGLWRRVSVAAKQLPEILRRLRRLEAAQGTRRTKDDV